MHATAAPPRTGGGRPWIADAQAHEAATGAPLGADVPRQTLVVTGAIDGLGTAASDSTDPVAIDPGITAVTVRAVLSQQIAAAGHLARQIATGIDHPDLVDPDVSLIPDPLSPPSGGDPVCASGTAVVSRGVKKPSGMSSTTWRGGASSKVASRTDGLLLLLHAGASRMQVSRETPARHRHRYNSTHQG